MATKKKSAPRRRASTVPGRSRKGRRRVSAKNKSIAGDIAGLGLGLGLIASPITGKVIDSVRSRSVTPMTAWSRDDLRNTAIMVGGGAIGGKIAGKILNKITPVKHTWNAGKKMLKGLV